MRRNEVIEHQAKDSQDEEWLPVVGYEGLYEVSSLGRIKRLSNSATCKEKILKPQLQRDGYLRVTLSKKGQKKRVSIHRIVMIAFIPNPENKKQVNHLDANKLNNKLTNLQWATPKENISHAIAHGLIKKKSIAITATNLDTGNQQQFESQSEASRTLFVSMNKISDVLNGRLAHEGGWVFEYQSDSGVQQTNRPIRKRIKSLRKESI